MVKEDPPLGHCRDTRSVADAAVDVESAANPDWAVRMDRQGVYTWTSQLDADKKTKPGAPRFWTMLQTAGRPLSLRREMKIGPADKWLAGHLGLMGGSAPRTDAVILRVDRRQVQPRKVPIRQSWQDRPAPLLFALDEYQGKSVTLELAQGAGGKPLHWQAVSTSSVPPAVKNDISPRLS